MTRATINWMAGILIVLTAVVGGAKSDVVHAATFEEINAYWVDQFGANTDWETWPSPLFQDRELLAKASPDGCFVSIGNQSNVYNPQFGNDPLVCPKGSAQKVNQSYVWGLTQSGNGLWFGTAPNVHCMVIGGYLQIDLPFQTQSYACEFGDSPFSPPLPPAIGDWRPPRIFLYDLSTGQLTEKTPIGDPLLQSTLGVRSAGALNGVILLGGPDFVSGINLFAFREDGLYLGSKNYNANDQGYTNIRKWLAHDGVLYTAVGATLGGQILRWAGNAAHPFEFVVVGELGKESGAELAVHDGRLFVSTWPGTGELSPVGGANAGIHMSPSIPVGGLTAAHKDQWQKVWSVEDYEPDPVTAATYGGGALASFGGYLYWGTMHVPLMSAEANILFYSQQLDNYPADAKELAAAAMGTYRAISLFRGKSFDTANEKIELLYGMPMLPMFDPTQRKWNIVANSMNAQPKFGLSGFGNFFNNYTWTMSVFDGKLFVGTMDWSYLLADGLVALFMAGQDLAPAQQLPQIIWPSYFEGADLFYFSSPSLPALPERIDGMGNYSNYGIRTMIASDALYLGMANPMNLFPLGGWELIRLGQADDDDGDGVGNPVEDAAPNGGDGNGDGIPDAMQGHVTSLPSAAGHQSYMTVELQGLCMQLADVQAFPVSPSDPGYIYPYGLVGFRIPCTACDVKIYYHGVQDVDVFMKDLHYRKYGPTPPDFSNSHWYDFNATVGVEFINGRQVVYVELHLEDGKLGDDTPVDFIIFDKGGIAKREIVEVPTLGEWGMILLVSILMLIALRRVCMHVRRIG